MKKKSNLKNLKTNLRFKVILTLGILLAFNTFAWFVYSSTISTHITATIKAWNIIFETEDQVTQTLVFNVGELYPGMSTYSNSIRITNTGDVEASVTYDIDSIQILTDNYSSDDYTQAELHQILLDYPFKTELYLSKTELNPNSDFAQFQFTVSWDYESGDDETDTLWGHNAYNFKELYPNDDQIMIKLTLVAMQVNP